MVRYADDFVVLVAGTREQAEAEKHALATFLKEELRMELSMEKTKITGVRGGFDFLGYRVVQTKALRTKRWVGNLFIPKGKLNDLRYKIKTLVKSIPTGYSLARLIDRLNPILTGWRNYYRYATRACWEFHKLDEWIWWRVGRWLRKKHRKARWRQLQRRFTRNVRGERRRWVDARVRLRFLWEGGTMHYPRHGIEIPNGWNMEPDQQAPKVPKDFWRNFNLLSSI